MRDLASLNKPVVGLTPAVYNTDQNGDTVDLKDFNGVLLVANIGVSADTLNGSNTIELEVEHSDNGSVWADATDNDLTSVVVGTNPATFALINDAAEDDTLYSVGYIGSKRYVRVVVNFTGTHTTGTPIGVVAVKGYPTFAPV